MFSIIASVCRHRLWLASFALVVAPCVALAQQTQKPADAEDVLRVSTELVQTDVSVFDKGGNFIDNLKPEQFVLKVDGRPQPVSFFERIVAGSVSEDAQIAAARGTSRSSGTSAAVPLDRGRAVVFFLDDLHLSPSSLVRTKEMLLRFIDTQLRQNDQMAIASTSNQLGFLSQLTDDKEVLRAAVARLTVREQNEMVDRERPWMNVAQAIAVEQRNSDVTEYFVDQTIKENPAFSTTDVGGGGAAAAASSSRDRARLYVQRRAAQLIDISSSVVLRTFDSLRAVLRTFGDYPGRKLVYFVSDGFALELHRNDTYDRVRLVTDAAVRAGAVVYTLDARGLGGQMADLPSAADGSSADPTGRLMGISMTNTTQEPLRTIADETGGRAILNTNSLELGVEKALKDTSVYYLLAWKPERAENRGGKFSRIEVSVKDRSDLTVLVQRGFYTSPPAEADAKRDATKPADATPPATGSGATSDPLRNKELFAALRSPFPRAALPTSVTLNYVRTKEAQLLLTVSVQVEIDATKPGADGALPTDRVEVIGALYNEQGKVVNTFQRTVTITPRSAGVEIPPTHRVALAFQSVVTTPGLYQVRLASRDPKNRRTGSTSQWIDVQDVTSKTFSISSIFLGIRPAVVSEEDAKADAAGPQLLVVADRRFAHDAPLRFLVYAYNATVGAGGKPDIAVQVQVFRDDQPVITAPLRKLDVENFTDFSRLPYAAELSMAGVPTGRYILRLTAIDRVAKSSASQSIKFTVE
jgi:VWFA-related protein